MPHPNGESPLSTPQPTGAAAQLIRLEPILGSPGAKPLLLARLLDICWVEDEDPEPGR